MVGQKTCRSTSAGTFNFDTPPHRLLTAIGEAGFEAFKKGDTCAIARNSRRRCGRPSYNFPAITMTGKVKRKEFPLSSEAARPDIQAWYFERTRRAKFADPRTRRGHRLCASISNGPTATSVLRRSIQRGQSYFEKSEMFAAEGPPSADETHAARTVPRSGCPTIVFQANHGNRRRSPTARAATASCSASAAQSVRAKPAGKTQGTASCRNSQRRGAFDHRVPDR